jgi:hypothetical protein
MFCLLLNHHQRDAYNMMIDIFLTAIGLAPVAVVQYTFTHKQYTEKHNKTEYTENCIHYNKNI